MVRYLTLGFAVLLILLNVPPSFAVSITYTVTFNEKDFYFWQNNGYDIIGHPECEMYGDIGAPQMLSYLCNFIIPRNEAVNTINIDSVTEE
jgi:hypothetical protein